MLPCLLLERQPASGSIHELSEKIAPKTPWDPLKALPGPPLQAKDPLRPSQDPPNDPPPLKILPRPRQRLPCAWGGRARRGRTIRGLGWASCAALAVRPSASPGLWPRTSDPGPPGLWRPVLGVRQPVKWVSQKLRKIKWFT